MFSFPQLISCCLSSFALGLTISVLLFLIIVRK